MSAPHARRYALTLRGQRARLQVETLEERCLLSWGAIPPAAIPVPTAPVAVSLNTQGTADISANEVDYYSFKILAGAAPATYVISATTPVGGLDTVLAVYDAAGIRLRFNDDISGSNYDSRVITFLPADPAVDQTYYFGITNLAGTPGGSYTWSVDGPADFFENNDTLATATDLGTLNRLFQAAPDLSDGHDWYRFTMTGAGTSADYVSINTTNAGNLDLDLTDAAGNVLRSSATAASTETISLNGLAAGTYNVHVYGANNPLYFLDIEPGTPPVSPMALDASGSATTAGMARHNGALPIPAPVPDLIEFQATVTGRVSILMRADTPLMQSLLSDPKQVFPPSSPPTPPTLTIINQVAVAGQFAGTQDYLIQFDVVAGRTYQFSAGVSEPGKIPHIGAYRLFLSTEPSDISATTPTVIPLDASGSALRLGSLETAGDVDLFAFTASVTGRTTVRVDGGADKDQVVHLLTAPGQTYVIQVFDPLKRPGAYALTITSVADDFPDSAVFPVVLDDTGAGNAKGTINYAGDEDVFRFTATQTGTMTVRMLSRPGIDTFSALVSKLSVTPTPTAPYEASVSRLSTAGNPAFDRILQFQVVQGQQYTLRASGGDDSTGDYLLSFAMAVDDNAGAPIPIHLFPDDPEDLPPEGSITRSPVIQTGSIETPQDQDRFTFATGAFEGFVIVALEPMAGTSMQGLLTVPSLLADPKLPEVEGMALEPLSDPVAQFFHFGTPPAAGGVIFQAFTNSGWEENSRSAFLGFFVKKGQTYEFLVSGNQTSIGEYRLTFGTYRGFAEGDYELGDTFLTRNVNRIANVDAVSSNTRFLKFDLFSDSPPRLFVEDRSVAPLPETGNTPGATNTRLAVFSLPTANPGTTTVTVPSGPATVAPNTLIASLLIVAARDNAVRPVESVVVAQGADAVSTFLTSLLIGVIATTTGGDATDSATVVGGTVYADQDANGRLNAGEPGVPGEKVVLEAWRDGRYVEVATAITDDQGAYSFGTVAAGAYRVRRLVKAGTQSTTPTSFEIKVINDGKPKTLNFGKPMLPGQTLVPAVSPTYLAALDELVSEEMPPALLGGSAPVLLENDAQDAGETDAWDGLIWLAPAALLGLAKVRRARKNRCQHSAG